MLTILIIGMMLTFLVIGGAWLIFFKLRGRPGFEHWNSREANRFMLKYSLILYFCCVVLIIFLMANAVS